jgi:hypothetical protein
MPSQSLPDNEHFPFLVLWIVSIGSSPCVVKKQLNPWRRLPSESNWYTVPEASQLLSNVVLGGRIHFKDETRRVGKWQI